MSKQDRGEQLLMQAEEIIAAIPLIINELSRQEIDPAAMELLEEVVGIWAPGIEDPVGHVGQAAAELAEAINDYLHAEPTPVPPGHSD